MWSTRRQCFDNVGKWSTAEPISDWGSCFQNCVQTEKCRHLWQCYGGWYQPSVLSSTRLSMDRHVSSIISSYYQICELCHIRPRLTFDAAKSVAVSIIDARFDCCNSLLYGTSQRRLCSPCLELTDSCNNSSVTSFQCHWASAVLALAAGLPTHQCQAWHSHAQSYPLWWCTELSGEWNARSSTVDSIALWHYYHPAPASRPSDFHRHSFAVSSLAVWNNVPAAVHDSVNLDTFKTAVKTHHFRPHHRTCVRRCGLLLPTE